MHPARTAIALLLLAGGLTACARGHGDTTREAPAPPDARATEPLDVEVSGCLEMTTALACEVTPGAELRLWIPGDKDARLAVTLDGRAAAVKEQGWPDGRTLRLVAPETSVALEVDGDRDAGGTAFAVRLVPAAPESPRLARARALRSEGALDQAVAILTEGVPDAGSEAAATQSMLARISYERGRIDDAVAQFKEAMALHRARGEAWSETYDATALMFLLLERGRFAEVRRMLDEAGARAESTPAGRASEARAWVTYFEGLLAWDTGDLRSALRFTDRAEAHAARLGSGRLRRMAAQSAARERLDIGRYGEAMGGLKALLASDGDRMSACDRADLVDNLGWTALLARESDPAGASGIDVHALLEPALAVFRTSCPDPNRVANLLENVALDELQRGRLDASAAALDDARRVAQEPGVPLVLFGLHLGGLLALRAGSADKALATFEKEARAAAGYGTADDQRVAAEDRAEALFAQGRSEAALAVLDEADARLSESGALIPLGEGKGSYFASRDRSTMLRVKLLVARHRDAEAMLAARRARGRLVEEVRGAVALERLDPAARARWDGIVSKYREARSAIDRDVARDWELSSDQIASAVARRQESAAAVHAILDEAVAVLSPPGGAIIPRAPRPIAPGEVELLYFPTDHGWTGFARAAGGVQARPLAKVDPHGPPDDLARALFSPFDPVIARATRIRLLPCGALRGVDLHALPWRNHPLLEHAPVEYVLDVGDESAARPIAPRALVVADPSQDLPAARAEGDRVAAAIGAAPGWTVQSLRGAHAGIDAVRASIGGAGLLHYAGHASFAGPDGLDSALPLAGDARLTPGDVIALPEVPPLVSLFGCETGRDAAAGALDVLGIANAFLVAGSSAVVAASRVVADDLARDVAAAYYARLLAPAVTPDARRALDPAAALRAALLDVRDRDAGAVDWAAFRLLVP